MSATLFIESDAGLVRTQSLDLGEHTVGSADSAIRLSYPTVSRLHGRIISRQNGIFYCDLDSRNGSFLGSPSRRLLASSEAPWNEDQILYIGPFKLSWKTKPEPQSQTDECQKYAEIYSCALAENPSNAHDRLLKSLETLTSDDARTKIAESIHYEFHGDGPLRVYLNNPTCREILINSYDQIFIDVGRGLERLANHFLSSSSYEAWAMRTAHQAGRRLDLQHPVCEATLANGARFHAVLSPISARGLSVAIRRFGSAPLDETTALETHWVDQESLKILKDAITAKLNIIISGGTSTGKTSLLNFMCKYLDPRERVLTVEDTVELTPPIENLVQLQARKANADGIGEVSLRQLVQCALRMRPDRIIVGECRGAEVIEMLQALNTGHPGSLTTLHANSTDEALHRLELLALLGATNLSIECIREWIRSTIDLIIQVERDTSGHRFVAQIARRHGSAYEIVYDRK